MLFPIIIINAHIIIIEYLFTVSKYGLPLTKKAIIRARPSPSQEPLDSVISNATPLNKKTPRFNILKYLKFVKYLLATKHIGINIKICTLTRLGPPISPGTLPILIMLAYIY